MNEAEQQFIQELATELGNYPEKEHIVAEYKLHVYELTKENGKVSYDELIRQLGTPREIAKVWRQETGVTPKKIQWLFVLLNISIFIGGTLLTVSYHIFQWKWVLQLWNGLTEIPFLLMVIYVLFWGLLGYEIGKEFGHRGKRLLKNTFLIAVIPNIVLMYLIVFKILPYEWFGSLINVPFIIVCILFTAILYPVSLIGYRWGKKVSV